MTVGQRIDWSLIDPYASGYVWDTLKRATMEFKIQNTQWKWMQWSKISLFNKTNEKLVLMVNISAKPRYVIVLRNFSPKTKHEWALLLSLSCQLPSRMIREGCVFENCICTWYQEFYCGICQIREVTCSIISRAYYRLLIMRSP